MEHLRVHSQGTDAAPLADDPHDPGSVAASPRLTTSRCPPRPASQTGLPPIVCAAVTNTLADASIHDRCLECQTPVEDIISTSIVGALCQVVQQPQHSRSREYLQSFVSQRFDLLVDTIEMLLKEDLVSGIDILCSCVGLVIAVVREIMACSCVAVGHLCMTICSTVRHASCAGF